jgi:hypothetical protein
MAVLAPGATTGQSALMVEPLPRWAKVFVGAMAAAIAALILFMALDDGLGEPVQAEWRVTPGTVLEPDDTRVPIDVHETECASGRSADGRVVVDVDYEATTVAIDIRVRRRDGDQGCPSNPITSFVGERWAMP